MNEKDLDLSKVNEIDTEIDFIDDDEDFGGPVETKELKPLIVNSEQDILNVANGVIGQHGLENTDLSSINQIDMECSVGEDDDDSFSMKLTMKDDETPKLEVDGKTPNSWGIFADFSDDEDDVKVDIKDVKVKSKTNINSDDYIMSDDVPLDDTEDYDNKELVDESMLEENKTTTQGAVEDDYWKKLQKKHAKTNVKGAYNIHFHMAGDPKAEMDDFNHEASGSIPTMTPVGPASSAEASGEAGGEGCCESLNECCEENNWNNLLHNIIVITGFELIKTPEGKLYLRDTCNDCADFEVQNPEESILALQPYIDDCFICPLQVETKQPFKTCKEWVDWYTPEMEKQYPQCKSDISYCDLIANHLSECKL